MDNLKTYRVVVDGVYYGKNRTFPALNDYIHACGRHPQIGAKMKRDYQMIAANAIRKQLGKCRITRQVDIHYSYFEADQKRDKDNINAFFAKVFADALQAAQVLINDGWHEIRKYSQDYAVDSKRPRVEITITEVLHAKQDTEREHLPKR